MQKDKAEEVLEEAHERMKKSLEVLKRRGTVKYGWKIEKTLEEDESTDR
jgi:hypothetical protein